MATDDLSKSLETLRVASESDLQTAPQLNTILQSILKQETRSVICQELIEGGVLFSVSKVLQNGSNEAQAKAAELIAELAKIEQCRLSCVLNGVVPYLAEKMDSGDTAVALQACRALGNICYEYDGGRASVLECGGAQKLLSLLKRAVDLPHSKDNHQLQLVATGFLLNLLNSYEITQDHLIDSELVPILIKYLDNFAEDEDIPTHILLSLSCMADTETARGMVLTHNLSPQLVKVLTKNASMEVTETCLELITNMAENENVKTELALGGVCEAVMSVVKRHRDEPVSDLSAPIIKTGTDLIVLILVGDESMGVLYDEGKGEVFKQLIEWLTSELEDLQIAGSLAIGNFARTDAHCISMVKEGIAAKLISVLRKHNTSEGDIRLQHALLSALRNLSIAANNKAILIEQGILDVLLPMVQKIETFPVVFKLLATIRMLVDGQPVAANKVGGSSELLKRLVEWSNVQEHPGVQGESSRILSWLVKNSDRTAEFMKAFVEAGALQPMVVMLGSEHAVMVNEAGLALALVFASKCDAELLEALKPLPFIEKSMAALKSTSLHSEVLCNILSAMVALTQTAEGVDLISSQELKNIVDSWVTHSNEGVKKMSMNLQAKIKIQE